MDLSDFLNVKVGKRSDNRKELGKEERDLYAGFLFKLCWFVDPSSFFHSPWPATITTRSQGQAYLGANLRRIRCEQRTQHSTATTPSRLRRFRKAGPANRRYPQQAILDQTESDRIVMQKKTGSACGQGKHCPVCCSTVALDWLSKTETRLGISAEDSRWVTLLLPPFCVPLCSSTFFLILAFPAND